MESIRTPSEINDDVLDLVKVMCAIGTMFIYIIKADTHSSDTLISEELYSEKLGGSKENEFVSTKVHIVYLHPAPFGISW